jgi:hypothetical protein
MFKLKLVKQKSAYCSWLLSGKYNWHKDWKKNNTSKCFNIQRWYWSGRTLYAVMQPVRQITGTCFIQKIYVPSSSLLQGKHLPFSSSPLRLNIFRLFVILSLTQLYRYTPDIFLFSTATFKYIYRAPLRRIGQE